MTDEELKSLAERYVTGEDREKLKTELRFTEVTFRRVLKLAKALHPELDWPHRKSTRSSPTKAYVTMNDGDPRVRAVPQGSVIHRRKKP